MRAAATDDRRGGFVLTVVVLMLFAISVASATGYLVVNTEFNMAKQVDQGSEAVTVARAGLHRFVAEMLGQMQDSVTYAIGSGEALITTRQVLEIDSLNYLYYIRSEGSVTDVMSANTPAAGVVGAYAYYRKRPLQHWAAWMMAGDGAYAQPFFGFGGVVDGNDHNTSTDCTGGGAPAITGAIAQYNAAALFGGTMSGSPASELWSGYTAVVDSAALRWDVLRDPDLPVDFDVTSPPNFGALPADSFPVTRVDDDLNAWSSWSGRGVLIVTGKLYAGFGFEWDGIILAGSIATNDFGEIRGMLIAGMDGYNTSDPNVAWRGRIEYYSCNVYAANESLSYLELVENSEFEVD